MSSDGAGPHPPADAGPSLPCVHGGGRDGGTFVLFIFLGGDPSRKAGWTEGFFFNGLPVPILMAGRRSRTSYRVARIISSTSRSRSLPKKISSPTKKVGEPKVPRSTERSVLSSSRALTSASW